MKNRPLDLNDFLEADSATEEIPVEPPEELDVQKAVVEELAAEKAELHEKIEELKKQIEDSKSEIEALKSANENLKAEKSALLEKLEAAEKEVEKAQEDVQERNPNCLALLDRDVELPDRFTGETRDHVLEVIKEARDKAESEGRVRRAQLLEGVLFANEPSGNLEKKRKAMEDFFNENGNIVNGTVISELTRCGIAYRNGEEYLLPKEIMLRTY
ncbi:MAG: hypothetical protein E7049_00145 [Lentisphaerae bacterium]|jgi:chromosome segregation ATPase|nr:hypothetical protein [Lentisphaerota bacterium]